TRRAGYAYCASRPPLMRERCLRTVLISTIEAPQASSARVAACLSASERPAAGAIQFAEAPPEMSTSTRSSAPAESEIERLDGRRKAGRVWQRVARLDDAHEAGRTAIAVTGDGETADAAFQHTMFVEIVAFGDLGHGTRGLAGRQNGQASGGGRRQ